MQEPTPLIIIGSRGRIGKALARLVPHSICPDRSVYQSWSQHDQLSNATAYFSQYANTGAIVIVASGLINPASPPQDINAVNFNLPRTIIDACSPLGIRVVTLGTILENLVETQSAYVTSKKSLNAFIRKNEASDITHMQIHTVYGGGPPEPFTFLGQIHTALAADQTFHMTPGTQLREYHHVDDIARAILEASRANIRGVIDLSHAQPLSLKQLAEAIFTGCHKPNLLSVGALPTPANDNFDKIYAKSPYVGDHRPVIQGVLAYMNTVLSADSTRLNRRETYDRSATTTLSIVQK